MIQSIVLDRSMDSGSSNFKIDEQDPEAVLGRGLGRGKGVLIDAGLHNMYVHAIRRAKHFLYIENQFFIGLPHQPWRLCILLLLILIRARQTRSWLHVHNHIQLLHLSDHDSANEDLHSSFGFDSGVVQKPVILGSGSFMLFRAWLALQGTVICLELAKNITTFCVYMLRQGLVHWPSVPGR